MSTIAEEKVHLAKAELHIVQGEARITQQQVLVDKLQRDGHDIREAEKFLATLRETLDVWNTHRDEILGEIARLDAQKGQAW
jgi:hypothetical protein